MISETRLEPFLVDFAIGPGKRAGFVVVAGDEAVDMGLELVDGLEGCTTEGLSAEEIVPRRVV